MRMAFCEFRKRFGLSNNADGNAEFMRTLHFLQFEKPWSIDVVNIYELSILQDGLIESVILSFTDITTTQCISQIVAKQKIVIQSLNNAYKFKLCFYPSYVSNAVTPTPYPVISSPFK